ncbi:MAG: M1 family aminopeptidase [Polyangiales bacterium]
MSGSSFAASLRHAAGLCRCRDQVLAVAAEAHAGAHAEAGGAPPTGRPFPFPTTTRKYERDLPFRIEHIALDLELDVDQASLHGIATLHVRRVDEDATRIALDAVAFDLESVELRAHKKSTRARTTYDDETLIVEIPRDVAEAEIIVTYRVTPKRGLYFLAPDEHVRDRPRQVWSQCQDEDARYWIPCHDKPHAKQTTEMRVRVPKGWFALSNGELLDHADDDRGSVYHWKQALPHSSYLITLCAGKFRKVVPKSKATSVPLQYYVPEARVADAERTFGRTGEMIALFEKKTGVKYPWVKYAQIVVHDFIFGGMENTSATTMYEHILLDERAAIDVDMDGLVAHELAHQWFGDLVTCRDWSEGWLNEGWATYMELVWKEEGTPLAGQAEGFGRDEYDYAVKGELDIYLQEDAGRYRRSIVNRDYDAPIDLFDRHLYQKGCLVLHVLRRTIGDKAFWAGVKGYLDAHAFGVVESRDFQRALEATSGRSLDRLFDAYVHGGGHPELEVSVEHEPATGAAPSQIVVSVKQTQKLDELTKLYDGPLVIEIGEGDTVRRERVHVRAAKDTFVLPAQQRPTFVVIDPDGDLLATIDLKIPSDLLRAQLAGGVNARARWLAAIALGKRDEPKTIEALAVALANEDEFWGVRAEAAEALGEIRGARAFEILRGSTKIAHAKVRRAVARALGRFKTTAAVEALKPLALRDDSYLVEADAARALGATRQAAAFDTLIEVLDRPSWADVVRVGAADGLAGLRDDRALPHLAARTTYGHPSPGRRACLLAMARIDTSRKTREQLEDRLDDTDVFVRATAVRGLELIGDVKARAALQGRLDREDAGTVRRRLREALRDVTAGREGELRRVRDELERMKEDSQDLRTRLAKLEGRLGEHGTDPTTPAGAAASSASSASSPRKGGGKPGRGKPSGKSVKGMGRAAAAARGGGTERKM